MTKQHLRELLMTIDDTHVVGDGDPLIERIVYDSRQECDGALFAALPGEHHDGTDYAQEALKKNAVALLVQEPLPGVNAPQIVSKQPRLTLAQISAAFFNHPARSLRLTGITGTNGKSTVAYGLRHILKSAGHRVGLLGTIEYDTGATVRAAPLTTPESVDFCSHLAEMVDAGAEHAVVEVSSHALSQDRVAGNEFVCAVFTNLTRDHLDYHGTMEKYCDAKKKLFQHLLPGAGAVINGDDPWSERLMEGLSSPVFCYGQRKGCDLRVTKQDSNLEGSIATVEHNGETLTLTTKLVGAFNVENCLAILGAATQLGLSLDDAVDHLYSFKGTPGRLERMVSRDGVTAFVDYAHTDDALRSVAQVLRPLTTGTLWIVFGCGGDRDRGKRPLMARAAETIGDRVVVTSDNPRTEDPQQIFADILAGFEDSKAVRCISDRTEAIEDTIAAASPGDVVLVAGKGHEDYQIIGTQKFPMDDRQLVEAALRNRLRSRLECK